MESEVAIAALSALAQQTRLAVFRHLVKAGPEGVSAGGLAQSLGVAAPTLSFHLKELERAHLVTARRDGRSIIYAADYDGFRALTEFLMEDCCGGDQRLCGPYAGAARAEEMA